MNVYIRLFTDLLQKFARRTVFIKKLDFSEKNVIMLHGHALDMRSVTDCNRL